MGEGWRQGNICCLPSYCLGETRYAWKSLQKLLKSDFYIGVTRERQSFKHVLASELLEDPFPGLSSKD